MAERQGSEQPLEGFEGGSRRQSSLEAVGGVTGAPSQRLTIGTFQASWPAISIDVSTAIKGTTHVVITTSYISP